jgi:hypothetical protein
MNEGEEFESLLPLSYRPQSARQTNQASKPARDVFAVQANDVANRLVRVMVDAVRNLRAASCDSAQEERRLRLEPSMRQGSRVRKNRRVEVEEIIDRLYSLPLAEFTTARNDAERELRKAGQKKQAARVKALRKPTAAASAVNRLVAPIVARSMSSLARRPRCATPSSRAKVTSPQRHRPSGTR